VIRAHIPPRPGWYPPPDQPPGRPLWQPPERAPWQPEPDRAAPVRVWADPHAAWQDKLYEQLLARGIVLASGVLDDEAAARLSAQLLTLDAEAASRPKGSARPVRLELQNLRADLAAAITVMGVLDVMRIPVSGIVSGEVAGPAVGLLACCARRTARPNATLTLSEPRLRLAGTATAISVREQQVLRMLDTLYYRLAEVTGRSADEIREDARRNRMLTTAEAIGYGLIQAQEDRPRLHRVATRRCVRSRCVVDPSHSTTICNHTDTIRIAKSHKDCINCPLYTVALFG